MHTSSIMIQEASTVSAARQCIRVGPWKQVLLCTETNNDLTPSPRILIGGSGSWVWGGGEDIDLEGRCLAQGWLDPQPGWTDVYVSMSVLILACAWGQQFRDFSRGMWPTYGGRTWSAASCYHLQRAVLSLFPGRRKTNVTVTKSGKNRQRIHRKVVNREGSLTRSARSRMRMSQRPDGPRGGSVFQRGRPPVISSRANAVTSGSNFLPLQSVLIIKIRSCLDHGIRQTQIQASSAKTNKPNVESSKRIFKKCPSSTNLSMAQRHFCGFAWEYLSHIESSKKSKASYVSQSLVWKVGTRSYYSRCGLERQPQMEEEEEGKTKPKPKPKRRFPVLCPSHLNFRITRRRHTRPIEDDACMFTFCI
jgi:hypothetical protein